MRPCVAPSALKLLDTSPTPRSRTGLSNAAASRLVERFHSTTQEISPEKQEVDPLLRRKQKAEGKKQKAKSRRQKAACPLIVAALVS